MERKSVGKPSYLTEYKLAESITEGQLGEGILEFLSNHKAPWIKALNHAKKSLKQKSDQKPIMDYLIAEGKLWDKLVMEMDKK